jgi:hypothetical protein
MFKLDNKWSVIAVIFILVVGVVTGLFSFSTRRDVPINTYEDCVTRGYEIIETFPQQCRSPKGEIFTENVGNILEKTDLIQLNSIGPGQTIEDSPLTIYGQARGNWFFEGSFPVEIIGSNGDVVSSGIATAEEDWMTEDFVPFSVTLPIDMGFSGKANLILHKDNPSGDPQFNDSLIIPIWINIPTGTIDIDVYFGKDTSSPDIESCEMVYPTTRSVPKTQGVAKVAIEALLKGPTDTESAQGFFTSLPDNVKLNRIAIIDGEAQVDFSSNLEEGVGGSCRVTAIRSQITETLKQFSSIDRVVISILGRTEDILQP